jgi:uncharacterized delta-60 repeat protein
LPVRRIVWYVRGLLARSLLMMSVIAACLTFSTAGSALAGAGALDTSYGQAGAAIADFGTFQNGAVVDQAFGNAMVVQPDGKVIVVGTGLDQFGQTNDIVTARFTTSGALDPSWGGTGRAQFDFGQNETGYGAVLQPDGKLIVGGDSAGSTGTSKVLAIRVNTDGTSDSTFGSAGVARPEFGYDAFGRAIALEPNGAIVIVGYALISGTYYSIAARLNNPQGTPDTSFFGTGRSGTNYPGFDEESMALLLEPDGTIATTGSQRANGSPSAPSNFSLTTFTTPNDDGASRIDLGGDDSGAAIALGSSGTPLIAGTTNVHGTYDLVVAQLLHMDGSGTLDPSFGSGGSAIVDLGGSDSARAMVVQPDGKIVVAGTSTQGSGSTGTSRIGIVRLLADGQLDPSFGTNGVEVVGIPGAKLSGNAVALQANGDIVVGGTIIPAGSTRRQLLVIRLHGDATGPASTGGGSTTTGGGSTTTTPGGGGNTGGGGASKTIPVLTSLAVAPSVFSAAPGGATVISSPSSRKGTLISYQLNVTATVSFVVERSLPGRRQLVNGKHRCEVQTHRNAHDAACTRVVTVGSFTQAGKAGTDSLRFSGRIDGKKLPRATYTLIATPKTLVAGRAVSKTFKIKG